MPNLFDDIPPLGQPTPTPEPVEDDLFADVPVFQPRPVNGPTDADLLQRDSERRLNEDALEDERMANPNANVERETAKATPEIADLPTPRSYTEAIAGTMKAHGHSYRPNPESSDDLEKLSSRMAYLQMARSGLVDENGALAGVDEEFVSDLTGAYLNNMTVLYADMTPEEELKVTQRALVRISESLKSNALSRLNAVGTRADAPGDEAEALRKGAEEDFAMAQELAARSDDPQIHAWFFGTVYRAADQLAMLSSDDTEDLDRNQIFKGMMDAPYKKSLKAGWPDIARGHGPLAERFSGLLERNLNLTDKTTGKAKAFALQKTLELSFRGTLQEERLHMLNIPQEFAEALDPASMLAFTHPRVVGRAGAILADNEARKYVAKNAEGPLPIATFNEKVEEWKQEHGADIADALFNGGMSPLMQLKEELDTSQSLREGLDATKDAIDKSLEGIGAYAMTGSDVAGDAIGKAQEFYGELLFGEEDEARAGEMMAGSTNLAIGAMATEAAKRMDEGIAEGEEDAALAVPPNQLAHHKNKWLSDTGALTQQVTDGDRVRLGLTKEASERIFNPGGNSLRQGAMWLADEVAATTVEKFAPLGFHPSVIRQAFRELRSEEFGRRLDDSILKGVTEEEFQTYVQTLKNVREENGGGATGLMKSWKETLGLAAMQVGRDVRATTQLLMEEPDDLAVITATGVGGGYIGNQLLRGLKNQTLGRVARMQTMHRARIAVQKALRNSPDAVDQMRRTMTLMQSKTLRKVDDVPVLKKKVGPEQRQALLEGATDALEYVSTMRKDVLELTPDLKNKRLNKFYDGQLKETARKTSEVMRHIDPREADQLLDTLDLDGVTRNWIKNAGTFSTLREAASFRLGLGAGNTKVPFQSGIGRDLFDTIANDPSVDLSDLPISPEAMNSRNMGFLARMFPGRQKQFLKAQYQQDALRWMAKFQKDTMDRRALGAMNRSNLEEFTKFTRVVESNRLRRIAMMKAAANGAGDADRVAALQELRAASLNRVSRARAVRQELIDSGGPIDKTRLRENPIFDDYTPEQMIQFLSVRHGRHRVYDMLRDDFESEGKFWGRVSDMGTRFDTEDAASDAAAARMKRRIIAEGFEQPGLDDTIRIDIRDGHISPSRLRRNIRERKNIGRAFLEDELDELREQIDDDAFLDDFLQEYDEEFTRLVRGEQSALDGDFITRKGLKSEWEEVKRKATTERANRFRVVEGISGAAEWGLIADISQRMGTGRPREAVQDAASYGMQQRLLTRAYHKKVDNMQRRLAKLSPEDRKLFNAVATIARDEGIVGPLKMLKKRKAFKDYFDDISPETDDIAVQRLWDESEGFRKSFLKDMADVGLIDEKTFKKLIGPYAPRLFSSTEMPKLYGTDGVDLSLRESKIRGVSVGELMSQRHISKVKAQIYPKGGRPITQKFDSVQDAERWIEQNYGFRSDATFLDEGAGSTGSTGSGSKYAILKPLGKEAQELGADFIGAGDGMFIQMRNLMEDMMQVRYFNAFDRKGIAFTPEQFVDFAREHPSKARHQYTKLPKSRKLGTLSGKHVHRSVLRQMDHYSEVTDIMGAIGDAVESRAMIAAGDINALIDQTPGMVNSFVNWQKAGIAYNMISRNPATAIGNALSDMLFFTRMAAGSEINLTARGWKMGAEAFKTIRGLRAGKLTLDDLDPDIRRGIELGVVDEGIFEVTGLENSRRVFDIEATYGQKKSPMDAFLAPLKDDNVRKALERRDQVEDLLRTPDISPEKEVRLLRERFALERVTRQNRGKMAKLQAGAMDILDGLVGKHRGRAGDIEGMSSRFYQDIGNTNRLRAYTWLVREKGMTPEAASAQINRYMQTYGAIGTNAVGRQVQKFGKSALGSPIVSFPFELSRISLNLLRHNPAGVAAMFGTSLARNLMAIGAGGQDPYQAMEFMMSQPGGPLNLVGHQFIPLPNQQSLVIGNPALNIFGQIFNGYGVVNGLASAWEDAGDETPLATTMRVGTTLTSNVAFTNPLLNFAMGMMSKRDSLTGDINRDGYSLLKDNVRRFMQPMIHPYTPRYGSFSDKLRQTRDPFKHAYSGREHSLFNRMFELGGFKVRGDAAAFLDALPDSLGDPLKDIALRGTKAAVWMSLWEEVPDQRVFGQSKGLTMEDYFALVVASSSYLDPQNGVDMAGANEQALTKMRRAINLLGDENAKEVQRGREMFKEAEANLIELRTTRKQASGLGIEVGREATEREVRNIVVRMMKLGEGYDEALETFSVLRRTGIVTRMAVTKDVPEEMMDNLFRQFLLTKSGGLRGPANSDELGQARELIDRVLDVRADITETNVERLETMAQIIEAWEAMAEAREEIEAITVEKYERANEVLKQAKGQ